MLEWCYKTPECARRRWQILDDAKKTLLLKHVSSEKTKAKLAWFHNDCTLSVTLFSAGMLCSFASAAPSSQRDDFTVSECIIAHHALQLP